MNTHISINVDQQQTPQTSPSAAQVPTHPSLQAMAGFTGLVHHCSIFSLPSEGPVPFDFRRFFVSQKPRGVDMEFVRTPEAPARGMLSPVGLPGAVDTTANTDMGRTSLP